MFRPAADEEAELDELLVEATWRRRTFPRQILPHVVHGLKAERKLMVGGRRARRWRCGGSWVSAGSLLGLCSTCCSVLKLLLLVVFQELFQERAPPLELPTDPSQGHQFGFR